MSEKLEVESSTDSLDEVISFVRGAMGGMDASKKSVLQLELVIEELFVNIANYAYPPGGGKVWISCDADAETMSVTITFVDRGPEFDPLATPDPDVTLSADERRIGGLGIFLVKRNVDGISYRRRDGCNVLTIEKRMSRRTPR